MPWCLQATLEPFASPLPSLTGLHHCAIITSLGSDSAAVRP